MDKARFRRIEELFHRAAPLDPDARRELLEREGAGDPELRRRVAALLDAGRAAEERIGGAVRAGIEHLGGGDGAPRRIGPYRVLREIGRGGFSTVYLAERDDEQFRMRVAIKLVRPTGADDVHRRLRRERQILADLDHPHIARILDGGSTEDGVPFLVIEHVDGEPIDVYCRRRGLGLSERLELFRRVCDAVAYAHRNLVLHRDVKPSNVLVTRGGIPKLLDFGIAKVLHDERATAELPADPDLAATLTRPGVRVLTPEYASPEQIEGRPLTTATDVYSLGVVLYLLVAGEPPYRFESRRWADVERVVCEAVPPPPSSVGSRGGGWRRSAGDLDRVVLKALRKEPERRYASVEGLSEDVRRYLAGEPVTARRDRLAYRATRFVARHRAAVAATLLVFLTLVMAVTVTAWQARVAREERRLAEEERTRAERVAGFLENLFEDASPYRSPDARPAAAGPRRARGRGAGLPARARELPPRPAGRPLADLRRRGLPRPQPARPGTAGRGRGSLPLEPRAAARRRRRRRSADPHRRRAAGGARAAARFLTAISDHEPPGPQSTLSPSLTRTPELPVAKLGAGPPQVPRETTISSER